jgi:hypothetical protein
MTTVKELKARRVKLVADRAECADHGLSTQGVDMAIFNVDRQLQHLLGDEDDDVGEMVEGVGDRLLALIGCAVLIALAWWELR